MSAQRIRSLQTESCDSAALNRSSDRIKTNRRTHGHDASQIRRFRRCDLRGANRAGAEAGEAIRKQIHALRADEGLFVITSTQPRALVGELGSQGFDLRLEPADNGDWFLWLW